jgi:multiple sugar transport system ATP-binding protein
MIDGAARQRSADPSKRGIAMVFQSYALYPHMSVLREHRFPGRVEKMPGRQAESAARSRMPPAFSISISCLRAEAGPAFRRPAPARRHRPRHRARSRRYSSSTNRCRISMPLCASDMRIEMARLHRRTAGNTMIYVTHDQTEAMTLADKIVVLNVGEISQVGAPLELYHKPANTSSRASSAHRA